MKHTALRSLTSTVVLAAALIAIGCSTDPVSPAPAPAATYRIAFVESDGYRADVALCSETGGSYRSITKGVGERINILHAWSPKATRIVYGSGRRLMLYDVGSNRANEIEPLRTGFLADIGAPVAWSPDGTRFIAISDVYAELSIFDSLGVRLHKVTIPSMASMCRWSPRGDLIAVNTNRGVLIVSASGVLLEELRGVGELYGWNREGDHVVTYAEQQSIVVFSTVHVSTKEARPFYVMPLQQRWISYADPHSNSVVLSGSGVIERIDIESGKLQVIKVPHVVSYAELRGDGEQYVYSSMIGSNALSGDTYVIDAEGFNNRLVRKNAILPRWSPVKR
jgi:hypothetical protein